MNEVLLKGIDLSDVYEEEFCIEELITQVSNELKENDLLQKEVYTRQTKDIKDLINGKFQDSVWAIKASISGANSYFRFDELDKYSFVGLDDYEINLIKCWVAESIIDRKYEDMLTGDVEFRSVGTVRSYFTYLINFIEATAFFSEEFLDDTKGCKLTSFFDSYDVSDNTVYGMITAIMIYIEYVEDKVVCDRAILLNRYMGKLERIRKNYSEDDKPRDLPTSRNILLYDNYIDMFFKDNSVKKEIKLLYMPILLWWKITTVIPMRPNEFCSRLKRDCLLQKEGKYYLKINRSKRKSADNKRTLPLLKRVIITKQIYDEISYYIKGTEKYGQSNTLISYPAIKALRMGLLDKNAPLFGSRHGALEAAHSFKVDETIFDITNMYHLLKKFNDDIIKGYYRDSYIDEWVKIGDTRHIAFTSLILQGFSPVEVAIIGGHTTLAALDNYTCSTNSYIDTQVVSMITKNIKLNSVNYSKIVDRIFSMPKECPKPINECIEAYFEDIQFGYCTADYKVDLSPCESQRCDECSKWWCEPTEYNYNVLEKILQKELTKKDNKIQRDLEFLKQMLDDVGIEYVDGKMVTSPEATKQLKRIALELDSNTKDIIHLKYQLVNPYEDKYKLLTDLEDLLPTKQVSEILLGSGDNI